MNDPLALALTPWGWLALGALAAVLELILPGVFMIWVAAAAVATAFLTFVFDFGWVLQVGTFALCAGAALVGTQFLVRRQPPGDDPGLNRRADRLVGREVRVLDAVSPTGGRVMVGDSPWPARGPELPAGALAVVVAVDGGLLRVEPPQPTDRGL